MTERKMVRRISDGMIFEAIRYGRDDKSWGPESITEIAAFVLGFDPDSRTTVANEHILDVVLPIYANFHPAMGKADISVTDQTSSVNVIMHLGDWLLRNAKTPFILVTSVDFQNEFQDLDTEIQAQLAHLIYTNIVPTEGETYQALAEKAANAIIMAGWSKKEK